MSQERTPRCRQQERSFLAELAIAVTLSFAKLRRSSALVPTRMDGPPNLHENQGGAVGQRHSSSDHGMKNSPSK